VADEAQAGEPTSVESLRDGILAQVRARQEAAAQPRYSYRRSIVTFIDILGFRALVGSRPADEIGRILTILGEVSAGEVRGNGDHPAGLTRAIMFSDSVVRVCPIDSGDRQGALFGELQALSIVQAQLAEQGVFLRGGLTVGDVYLQGDLIFGPAMVRAYELENSYAIFPRIVVDPAVITAYAEEPAMQGDDNDPEEDVGYFTTLLREGDDQIPFVDYLTGLQDVLDEPDEYISMLRQHRSRLVAAANALSGFNNAKQKYLWLASYHNAVCTGLPENVGDVGPLIELDELGSLSTS